MRRFALALVLSPALVLLGCPRSDSASEEPSCTGALALSAAPIAGQSLATKQIALTFDDGPASRTAELSAYLKGRGIRAAFFVNGQNVAAYPGILQTLVNDGHVVANHTQTHPSLISGFPNTPAGDAARVKELSDTDAIIAPFVPAGRFMFRAPFGDYNLTVYGALQPSAMNKYVGHIDWDIGGERTATTAADWACWQNAPKLTSKQCGDLYVAETDAIEKGIVLMHDADYGDNANADPNVGVGNTIDMVKYMVPILEAKGYTFKRLDEVPAIAALLPPLPAADGGADASEGGVVAPEGGVDASTADASARADAEPPPPASTTAPTVETAPPPAVDAGPCPPAADTATAARAHAH